MKNFRLTIILILAALSLPVSLHARRPRGTEMTGVITQVDHSTRNIAFTRSDGKTLQFVYAGRTRFWHGGQDSSPTALKPGMQVQIDLHNPLIGPDFVTQIVLITSQKNTR